MHTCQECVLNYRLEPLGLVDGFTAEVGASGSFCPSHLTLPVDVSFYSVSDDNAPSPYMVNICNWFVCRIHCHNLFYIHEFVVKGFYAAYTVWSHDNKSISLGSHKRNLYCLQGVINLESLGKRGYRVPPSGTIQVVMALFKYVGGVTSAYFFQLSTMSIASQVVGDP